MTLRGAIVVSCLSWGLAGCLQERAIECADGSLCPGGTVCVVDGCADQVQIDACDGLAEGATCEVPGFGVGACHDGVCRATTCGNQLVDPGEACDDGNGVDGDGCARDCLSDETCGNAVRDAGEQCDDGNLVDGDGCQAQCTAPRCGDAIVDAGEACDDGNDVDGDGCQATCLSDETCGNGFVDVAAGEECDQGAGLSHDGCASACLGEVANWTEVVAPTLRRTDAAVAEFDGRLIVVGGESQPGDGTTSTFADTWAFDGYGWTLLRTAHHPPPLVGHALVNDVVGDRLVLFGGRLELPEGGNAYSGETWTFDGIDWTNVTPATSPSPRIAMAMAYDADQGVVVLHGGNDVDGVLNDTWELAGDTWQDVTTALAPPPSAYRSMTYQPMLGGCIMIGGAPAHTWRRDVAGWHDQGLTFGAQPHNVYRPLLATDPFTGITVLLNRSDSAFGWRFDGAWHAVDPGTEPPSRSSAAIASGGALQGVFVFGGYADAAFEPVDQLWQLRGDTWGERTPSRTPPGRFSATMAYDAARARIVLFGGFSHVEGGPYENKADTWEFDGAAWQVRRPLLSPPGRQDAVLAYDTRRQRVVLFGGRDDAGNLNDTWAYDGVTWRLINAASSPPARTWATLVGDAHAGHVLLAGGEGAAGVLDDTWALIDDTWTELAPLPAGRAGHMAAYDARRERVVLFGGTASGGGASGDTWEHDGTTWSETTPAASPPARYIGAMAFDASRGRTVLFGGGAHFVNDYWEYDGLSWMPRLTANQPAPRELHSMAYDAANQRVVMFGGIRTGTPFSADTWTFAFDNAGAAAEVCRDASADDDGDGLAGCDDPDCWARCAPSCPPGVTCDAAAPRCGDGSCAPALEDYVLCPADCVAP